MRARLEMVHLPRVPSGIPGFDELCGGGLVQGRTYLVTGPSGSGKTLFGLQFLYHGAADLGQPGILLAAEERPSALRENGLTFGWDLQALEEEGLLAIIDGSSAKMGVPSAERFVASRPFDVDALIDRLIAVQHETGATRVVVDSCTRLLHGAADGARSRVQLLKLARGLGDLGFTGLMTVEAAPGPSPGEYGVESSLGEGVVALYYGRQTTESGAPLPRVRSLEIYKMRGTPHARDVYPFDITDRGIVIHVRERLF